MINKVFLLSNEDDFSSLINSCLDEDSIESEVGTTLPKYVYDIVIINLISLDEKIEAQIDEVIKTKVKKIILIENALDLYLNSKNKLPYSVYSEIIPKNEICKRRLLIEQKIVESKKKYVIFRVSDIYGISISDSLIESFLFSNSGNFENSERDFIYDGDVISAIEIALRKNVTGIFDIASGESIELKKLVELIKKIRNVDEKDNIKWSRKKIKISINCDNFKYYKWEPLVGLEMGLKTLLSFRRKNVKLSSTRNNFRKNF